MDISPLAPVPPQLSPSASPPADLRAAAEGFESLFLAELLKGGRASLPGDDLTGSQGVTMAQDMMDRHLAQHAAGQAGLGVAAAILRQFGPKAE
jgi:peptidoglycan hydrolase FlgJ